MYPPWNTSQDKYNQDRYKGENKNSVYWNILGFSNNWQTIYCIDSRKQHESTETDINVYIKQNAIKNIALNIRKYIKLTTIMKLFQKLKNAENGYYIIEWTSDIYTFHYSHKIGRYVIKSGELVCDEVYFNQFANFKQFYTPHGGGMKKTNCQVEY